MMEKCIQQIFAETPEVIYGYTDISYSPFSKEYQSALVFAVPYDKQLNLNQYTEEGFEESIRNARRKLEKIVDRIEQTLKENHIKYYIPSVAQKSEEDLLAEFSFKYAAVNAGLGWIGKNDVLITEKYGPRVRLSVIGSSPSTMISLIFSGGRLYPEMSYPILFGLSTNTLNVANHFQKTSSA